MENYYIWAILVLAGFTSAFINIMAGAGSIVSISAMLLLGVPSIVALSTFRMALFFQCLMGIYILQSNQSKVKFEGKIFLPVLIGSFWGSYYSLHLSKEVFNTIFAFTLVLVLLFVFLHKKMVSKNIKIPFIVQICIFFFIGFYGGFIQVGIGFLLLIALSLIKKQDIILANATKLLIILFYVGFSTIFFAFNGKIIWEYALFLSFGAVIGAYVSCQLALAKGEKFAKLVLVLAVLLSIGKLVFDTNIL